MLLSLVKKAAPRCGLALVTLVLASLAGLVFGPLLVVAFLFGKSDTESGPAVGGREKLHDMIEALPDEKVAEARDLLRRLFNGERGVHCDTPRVQGSGMLFARFPRCGLQW